jgi:class 3 adenylate cyclase
MASSRASDSGGSTSGPGAPTDSQHASREELLREIELLQRRIERLESGAAAGPKHSIIGLADKVIQLTEDDHIEYVNRALVTMAGVVRDDIIGKHLSVVDRFPWGEGLLSRLLASCRTWGGELIEDVATVDGTGGRRYFRVIVNVTSGKPQILIQDITAVKLLENTFKRYVSPAVMQRMVALEGEKNFFTAERYEMTVLFCDLRGFTAMSESMSPEDVRAMINEYLTAMTDVILRHEGTLDKFVGDAVMALFGAPIYHPDHAIRALRVGLEMQAAHRNTQARWRAQRRPTPGVGIGVNTGEMVVGNMGSPLQVNYSVLGHPVNVAARLCSTALAGEVLLGERSFAAIEPARKAGTLGIDRALTFERRGCINAKGISTPIEIISVAESEPDTVRS